MSPLSPVPVPVDCPGQLRQGEIAVTEVKMENEIAKVAVGLVVIGKGDQRYRCIGIEPYLRTDGKSSFIATWESPCRVCDRPFTLKGSASVVKVIRFNRTCPDHHRQKERIDP